MGKGFGEMAEFYCDPANLSMCIDHGVRPGWMDEEDWEELSGGADAAAEAEEAMMRWEDVKEDARSNRKLSIEAAEAEADAAYPTAKQAVDRARWQAARSAGTEKRPAPRQSGIEWRQVARKRPRSASCNLVWVRPDGPYGHGDRGQLGRSNDVDAELELMNQRLIDMNDETNQVLVDAGCRPRPAPEGQCKGEPMRLKLYHGTSWERAQQIKQDGFIASQGGCLGPGVYVARRNKALRFAQDKDRHGGSEGGLVEVLVTIRNPKYASGDDSSWYGEGHDACRAEKTSASTNMEWCVRDKSKVQVLRISRVPPTARSVPAE